MNFDHLIMNPTWKEREPAIKALVPDLLRDLILLEEKHPVTIRVFFCEGVMAVARYLRETTKAMEPGATHHVFKILAKHAKYGDRGRLEASEKGERMDIYFEDTMERIEVKTLVMATLKTIHRTVVASFTGEPVNHVWIFYFSKFKENASPRPPCQYLLVWIDINSLDIDFSRVGKQVIAMVQKTKQKVAKKLGVPGEILVPVENIIKVEDLERELKEKDKILKEKNKIIEAKEKEIAELKRQLGSA